MRLLYVGLLAVTAIQMSAVTYAGTRVAPPHPERDNMSEARKRELVLDDLRSILTGPASSTTITTEPYASSEAGLCQRDVIQLKYARQSDDRPNSPVYPLGIRAISVQYHFLDWPDDGSWTSWQKACARLSDQKIYWAFGDDDHHASFALGALKSTVADVRKGQRFTLDCEELNALASKTSCLDVFLSAAEKISSISRRVKGRDNEYGFTSTPYKFTIVRTYSQELNGGYLTTIKIQYEEIVVT